jgi:PAS domain S-box-containing protein
VFQLALRRQEEYGFLFWIGENLARLLRPSPTPPTPVRPEKSLSPSLLQQLRNLGLSPDTPPADPAAWSALLNQISNSYVQSESLVHSALDHLFLVGRNGKILFLNRSFGGRDPDALIGQSVFSLFETRVHRVRKGIEFAFSGHTHECGEVVSVDLAGERRFLSLRCGPLNHGTDPSSVMVCATDTTEQKSLKELMDSGRSLRIHAAKMIALGEMAGGIAHEINSPLSALRLLSEQLDELTQDTDLDRGMIADHARKVGSVVTRISEIVRGLRNFARNGEKDPFVQVDISQLISNTLAFCSGRFTSGGVKLDVHPVPAGLRCMGREVILNLLNNAYDAVEGESHKRVQLEVSAQDSTVEIVVTDSGSGIPAEIRDKIFQPFFTTKEVGKGTGMGLSISKSLMEEHGGSLRLDSQLGSTRFVLELRRAESAAEEKKAA